MRKFCFYLQADNVYADKKMRQPASLGNDGWFTNDIIFLWQGGDGLRGQHPKRKRQQSGRPRAAPHI
jgi:hypothetical protein